MKYIVLNLRLESCNSIALIKINKEWGVEFLLQSNCLRFNSIGFIYIYIYIFFFFMVDFVRKKHNTLMARLLVLLVEGRMGMHWDLWYIWMKMKENVVEGREQERFNEPCLEFIYLFIFKWDEERFERIKRGRIHLQTPNFNSPNLRI